MALIGLVNLAERLFIQTQGNPSEDSGLTTESPKGNASEATQHNIAGRARVFTDDRAS